jgi:hypothetical protein
MKFQLMKSLSFLLLLFVLQSTHLNAQAVEKLRIDPAMAFGGAVSEYFDQVNYVPLETNKESLFGDISQLVITDSSYVIHDYDTKAVLFFSLAGKYITKIKFKEGIYPLISYDKEKKRVVISNYDGSIEKSVTKYYSLVGKELVGELSVKSILRTNLISLNNGFYVGSGSCYFDRGMKPVDSTSHLLKIYKGDSLYKSFLPYNQTINTAPCAFSGWLPRISLSPEAGVVYVSPPFDGGIYRVTKDTVVKAYQVVFPASRSIPKNIAESKDMKVIDSLRNANWPGENVIVSLANIFFQGNLLFFKINAARYMWTQGSEFEKQYNFILDIKTGKLVSMERMKPDEMNGFLPFVGMRVAWNGLDYINGSFYTSVSSLQLFNAKEATAERKPKYSSVMEKFFVTESRKSNPVIVQLKLKG